MVAANYKCYTGNKNMALNTKLYYASLKGANEAGLKVNGMIYPIPNDLFNLYATIGVGGYYRTTPQILGFGGEAKAGAEVDIGPVELFGEGGLGMTYQNSTLSGVNIIVNAGLRVYIF